MDLSLRDCHVRPPIQRLYQLRGRPVQLRFHLLLICNHVLCLLDSGRCQTRSGSFDPVTGQTTRNDRGVQRWIRGFKRTWYISLPVLVFAGCGLATSGMGTWSAILALEAAFAPRGSVVTSWTCTIPFYAG